MGLLQKVAARLTTDPEQIRDQEVRTYCSGVPAAHQIAETRLREHARVVGVVQSIKLIPRQGSPILEIQIYDGTDELVGIWYGRSEIPGVALGRPVVFEGTMMKSLDRKDPFMINPAYHLVGAEAF